MIAVGYREHVARSTSTRRNDPIIGGHGMRWRRFSILCVLLSVPLHLCRRINYAGSPSIPKPSPDVTMAASQKMSPSRVTSDPLPTVDIMPTCEGFTRQIGAEPIPYNQSLRYDVNRIVPKGRSYSWQQVPKGWAWIDNDDNSASNEKAPNVGSYSTNSGNTLSRKVQMVVPTERSWNHTYWSFDSVTKNATSVVFYGSSHLRELYMELVRLRRGVPFSTSLEETVWFVPSGVNVRQKELQEVCDPKNSGYVSGLFGVDLKHCGPPGKRLVPELGEETKVAYAFKTFLHTPEADDLLLPFLQDSGGDSLRHPSVLVVDIGIWGPRGRRVPARPGNRTHSQEGTGHPNDTDTAAREQVEDSIYNVTLSPREEVDYYLDWLSSAFPRSHIVYVYDTECGENSYILTEIMKRICSSSPSSSGSVSSGNESSFDGAHRQSSLIRKDLIRGNRPANMPYGHGGAGPLMEVVARLFLRWLQDHLNQA